MRRVVRFAPAETLPPRPRVLARAGLPEGREPPERLRRLLDGAIGLYLAEAAPVGLVEDVTVGELLALLEGEGTVGAPAVAHVAPRAERLALFAATVGEPVSSRVRALFAGGEAPLGFFLDAVASEAAATLADLLAGTLGPGSGTGCVVAYSPGYCGWRVTGQRALFRRLAPDDVGIVLGEGALMTPMKSVSGVLVAGPESIQRARGRLPDCATCTEPTCGEGRWTS